MKCGGWRAKGESEGGSPFSAPEVSSSAASAPPLTFPVTENDVEDEVYLPDTIVVNKNGSAKSGCC